MIRQETTRDRLIELLDIIIQPGEKTMGDIADYLLENIQTVFNMSLDEFSDLIRAKQENRIIVPPCKVGG